MGGGCVAGRTGVDHHHRAAGAGQDQGCGEAGGAAADHCYVVVVHVSSVAGRPEIDNECCCFRELRGAMGPWRQAISAALDLVGPRLRKVREQRGITLDRRRRAHRHLEEHAVAAGERPAAAEPGAAAAAGPGLPGAAGRPGGRARGRRPADPAQAAPGQRAHRAAADPASGRRPGVEDRDPREPVDTRSRAPTTATSGSTCWPAGCGSSWATRTSSSGWVRSAEFDTQLPHWFGSTGEGPAEVLSIFGRPGERMHVRASARGGREEQ